MYLWFWKTVPIAFAGSCLDYHFTNAEVFLVPSDGFLQSLFKAKYGLPVEPTLGLGAIQILPRNFMRGLVQDHRLERTLAHRIQNPAHHIDHRQRGFIAEVERVAGDLLLGELLGEQQVSFYRIANVKVVAHKTAVAADDRRFAPQNRANGAGNEAVVVQVASAK